MKTNQLKLAALSLALVLPISYISAVCNGPNCKLRARQVQDNQVPYFPGRDAATPAPVATVVVEVAKVEAPKAQQAEQEAVVPSVTATSIPVPTEEINLDDLDFDEEDEQETGSSWKVWALGAGALAVAVGPVVYFWNKKRNANLMAEADRLSDATQKAVKAEDSK